MLRNEGNEDAAAAAATLALSPPNWLANSGESVIVRHVKGRCWSCDAFSRQSSSSVPGEGEGLFKQI